MPASTSDSAQQQQQQQAVVRSGSIEGCMAGECGGFKVDEVMRVMSGGEAPVFQKRFDSTAAAALVPVLVLPY
jgi:hypothetical protein